MAITKHTILVVEDEPALAGVIARKLEMNVFDAVTVRSVEEAVARLHTTPRVDVIWLDHYLLGKENGLDLVVALKADDSPFKDIPIYVVSNTATPDKVKSYLQLGVQKYYTKADNKLEDIIADIQKQFSH
jgi:CheY-like chemotaxis protein